VLQPAKLALAMRSTYEAQHQCSMRSRLVQPVLALYPHGLYTSAYNETRCCYTAATEEAGVDTQGVRDGICHADSC